jgi:hypothetical protein
MLAIRGKTNSTVVHRIVLQLWPDRKPSSTAVPLQAAPFPAPSASLGYAVLSAKGLFWNKETIRALNLQVTSVIWTSDRAFAMMAMG